MRIYTETFARPALTARYTHTLHGGVMDEIGWAVEDIDAYRRAGNAVRTAAAVGRVEGLLTALYIVGAIDEDACRSSCDDIRTAMIGGGA